MISNINVAKDPWIPVLSQDGSLRIVNVEDAFFGNYKRVDGSNFMESFSIFKFLVTIMNGVVLPYWKELDAIDADEDMSYGERNAKVFGFLKQILIKELPYYLDKWKDRFNMFDEKCPFLQNANLQLANGAKPTDTLSFLSFDRASGNNPTFFDSAYKKPGHTYVPTSEELVVKLLAHHNGHHHCGITSAVSANGFTYHNGNAKYSVCAGGILHSFPIAETLLDSIILCFVNFSKIESNGMKVGRPVWELPVELIGNNKLSNVENATETFLGRMTPHGKMIRLFPDNTLVKGSTFLDPGIHHGKGLFTTDITNYITVNKAVEKQTGYLKVGSMDTGSGLIYWMVSVYDGEKSNNDFRGPLWLNNLHNVDDVSMCAGALCSDQGKFISLREFFFTNIKHLVSKEIEYQKAVGDFQKVSKITDEVERELCSAVYMFNKGTSTKKISASATSLKESAATYYRNNIDAEMSILLQTVSNTHSQVYVDLADLLFRVSVSAFKTYCVKPYVDASKYYEFLSGFETIAKEKLSFLYNGGEVK